jgi:hypothetical protein
LRKTDCYFSIPTAIRTKTPAAETAGLGKDPVRGVGAAEVAWRIMAAVRWGERGDVTRFMRRGLRSNDGHPAGRVKPLEN